MTSKRLMFRISKAVQIQCTFTLLAYTSRQLPKSEACPYFGISMCFLWSGIIEECHDRVQALIVGPGPGTHACTWTPLVGAMAIGENQIFNMFVYSYVYTSTRVARRICSRFTRHSPRRSSQEPNRLASAREWRGESGKPSVYTFVELCWLFIFKTFFIFFKPTNIVHGKYYCILN